MKINTSKFVTNLNKGGHIPIVDDLRGAIHVADPDFDYAVTMVEYSEPKNYIGPFCVVSAPGATGKSALSHFIASQTNAHIWNLANATLGDNFFLGTLATSHGPANLANVLGDIQQGSYTLIVDAIDEVEIASGWQNIEKLIGNIGDIFPKKLNSVVLLARNETANYLKMILEDKFGPNSFTSVGVEYFDKTQIGGFCEVCYRQYKKTDAPQRTKEIMAEVIANVVAAYQNASKMTNDDDITRFIGYAPVLQAIVRFVCDYDNPQEVLGKEHAAGNYINVIKEILEHLLTREQSKLVDQFRKAASKVPNKFAAWETLYTPSEQIERLLALSSNKQSRLDLSARLNIPAGLAEIYQHSVDSFLLQHPFLLNDEFAGPAFYEYSVNASLLGLSAIEKHQFLRDKRKNFTPLLWEFYKNENPVLDGTILGFMVDSIVAGQRSDQQIGFSITDSNLDNGSQLSILIEGESGGKSAQVFPVRKYGEQIWFNQYLTRVSCKTRYSVQIGANGQVDLCDTYLECNEVIIDGDVFNINQYGKEERTTIIAKSCVAKSTNPLRINRNGEGIFEICWQDGKQYPWTEFYQDLVGHSTGDEFRNWYLGLRSILCWFRKDKRSNFGKYKSMIDNVAVGSNEDKQALLEFLKSKKVITERAGDNHYLLSTEKLENIGVNFASLLRLESSENAKRMYKEFIAFRGR